jgi:hypothetical protein
MSYAVTVQTLLYENRGFAGSCGISQNNRSQDFHPGFYDCESRQILISRFADSTPAPIHPFDSLPRHWVTERNAAGRVRIPSALVSTPSASLNPSVTLKEILYVYKMIPKSTISIVSSVNMNPRPSGV